MHSVSFYSPGRKPFVSTLTSLLAMKIVMGFFYVVPLILFMIMGTCLAFYVYMGHSEAQNMTLCAGGYGPSSSISCPCEVPDW